MPDFYNTASYLAIAVAAITGLVHFRWLSGSLRIIVFILLLTLANEVVSVIASFSTNYALKYTAYHVYDILLSGGLSCYFIYTINPAKYKAWCVVASMLWATVGVINFLFFQPLHTLNTNMLVLESAVFVNASLYFIHYTIRKDVVSNIFTYPHFWISLLWLTLWGTSLFFWAYVKILYRGHWQYVQCAIHAASAINVIVYSSMTVILARSGNYSIKHKQVDSLV